MSVNIRGMTRRGFVETSFGANGTNPCVVTFAVKNDLVAAVFNMVTGATASSQFESTVTVTGQVQQTSSTNNSANEFDFFIQPQS
jgi:hypothetical protein